MSLSDDIHIYTALLNRLLKKLKKNETFQPFILDPDLYKKITMVRRLIKNLKEEENKQRNHLYAAKLEKSLQMVIEHNQALELDKVKKDKKRIKMEMETSFKPKLTIVQLRPTVSIDHLYAEYKRFIDDLLQLSDENNIPLYVESDFVFIAIGPNQLRPVFRFPNEEVTELFSELLLTKGMVTLADGSRNLQDIKKFLAALRAEHRNKDEAIEIEITMEKNESKEFRP